MNHGQHSAFGEPIHPYSFQPTQATHLPHYPMHNYFFKRVSRAVYFAKCLEILNKISGLICFLTLLFWALILFFSVPSAENGAAGRMINMRELSQIESNQSRRQQHQQKRSVAWKRRPSKYV